MTEKDREELIAEEILSDTEKKASRVRQRAEHEARKMAEKAESEDKAFAGENLKTVQEKVLQKTQMILASIDLEVRKLAAGVKEEVLDEIIHLGLERLYQKKEYDYPHVLKRLAIEALMGMEGEDFFLSVNPEDQVLVDEDFLKELQEAVREERGGTLQITVQSDPSVRVGVIVSRTDGRLLYDNTFDARERRMRNALRRGIHSILFGDDSPEGGC